MVQMSGIQNCTSRNSLCLYLEGTCGVREGGGGMKIQTTMQRWGISGKGLLSLPVFLIRGGQIQQPPRNGVEASTATVRQSGVRSGWECAAPLSRLLAKGSLLGGECLDAIGRIEVRSGVLWVTGSPADGDQFLRAGDHLDLRRQSGWVVEALEDSEILLIPKVEPGWLPKCP